MKQINLAQYHTGPSAPGSQVPQPIAARATLAVRPQPEARQLTATVWIIAAWLIGTLVWELNVVGAEPPPAVPIATNLVSHESMVQRWETRETEFAITLSGIDEFDRIQRHSELRQTINAIIAQAEMSLNTTDDAAVTQTSVAAPAEPAREPQSVPVKNALPQQPSNNNKPRDEAREVATVEKGDNSSGQRNQGIVNTDPPDPVQASAADVAQTPPLSVGNRTSVELAYEESVASSREDETTEQTATQFAWNGFSEGSIPGLVELVVHSFNELMTPVHVRPLASDQTVVTAANDRAAAEGPVTFVETDTQDERVSTGSLEQFAIDEMGSEEAANQHVTVQPRKVASPPFTRPIIATRNPHHVIRLEQHTDEPTNLRPALDSEAAQIIRSRPHLLRVPEHSVMLPAPGTQLAHQFEPSKPATAKQPVRQLAAKWPFERSEPATSSGVSLNVDDADVRTVFEMLARGYHMNILVAPEVEGVVTANVEGLSPEQTLQGIVKMCGLSMQQDDEMIYIYSADKIPSDARQLRVFPLDFARAATLEPTIQGLLSPVGNAYPSKLDSKDNLQTQETLVVVDIPAVIEQVENYILQADQAPRQVMIEARVLEVELSDDMMHGINFDVFSRRLNLKIGSHGLADPIASSTNPLFFAQLEGSELNGLLDFIETTTDSKTLASPRVQVINGQNARIQVGQQLGFTVATVTQTSTIQDVQFLETGVVLSVTPTISRDNRILMQVKPEVSDGVINPDTLLPEEETREVETSVLLDDHQGVIIGGLIQEKDRTVIRKFPWLGDVKHVGKFFQRREAVRSRSEIIVALIPHIVDRGVQDERSTVDYERTETPLLHGVLQRTCRPWEPRLPDRAGEERHMDVNRLNRKLP